MFVFDIEEADVLFVLVLTVIGCVERLDRMELLVVSMSVMRVPIWLSVFTMCAMVRDVLFVLVLSMAGVMLSKVCIREFVEASSLSIFLLASWIVMLAFLSVLVRVANWVCTGWVLVVLSSCCIVSWWFCWLMCMVEMLFLMEFRSLLIWVSRVVS